jgi:hypothetical protein
LLITSVHVKLFYSGSETKAKWRPLDSITRLLKEKKKWVAVDAFFHRAVVIGVGGAGAWYFHRPGRGLRVGSEAGGRRRGAPGKGRTGDLTIVTSGLVEGERVVVNGQYKLRAGSRVTADDQPLPAVAKKDRSI